ncbi:MAG: amidohydrolase family protein [Gammaproteobacteria bacterium]|nr:amidohydrolase family protein [Gammaproteobacteria bacterium]
MSWLSKKELKQLSPAEQAAESPVPTRIVSNGEFNPLPQTDKQKRVEARINELSASQAQKAGMSRRQFLQTASGMAAAFVAMNEVYGPVFSVAHAEVSDADAAAERAAALAKQFVFDNQLHFVRDDYDNDVVLGLGQYAADHWNPGMLDKVGLELYRYKFENFIKEVYLDSDTKVGLLSGASFDDPDMWILTNDQMAQTKALVNEVAGARRLLCHSVISPAQDGWMDAVDHAIEVLQPDSWKGYTVGDPLDISDYPWRLDDEKLMYPFYEKAVKAGINTICIHKGLLPLDYEKSMPDIWEYAKVDDLPRVAQDWPEINFVIYHAAFRPFLESPDVAAEEFERTGYIQWASDLAAIPEKYGVDNVYAEVGTSFANCAVSNPRLAAGLMGTLIKGMGVDKVIWGTDSVWYGSPQWQIEALRRLEIPEDMQQKHGFAPLGAADGAVKNAIFGLNAAPLYNLDVDQFSEAVKPDAVEQMKAAYKTSGIGRSNVAYGYVAKDRN